MRIVLLLILTLISFNGYSQIEGSYGYNYEKNKFYVKSKASDFSKKTKFACDSSLTHPFLEMINRIAKEYIISRSNLDFYNSFKLFTADVSYLDPKKRSSYTVYYNKPHKHQFWFSYSGKYNGVFYSFAFRFDEQGKAFFNLNFPSYDNEILVDKIIDPKKALRKAQSVKKSLKRGKVIKKFEFLNDENVLCYVFEKDPEVSKHLKQDPVVYEYTAKRIFINAYTNEVIKKEKEKERVFGIAPTGILTSPPKKKKTN